VEEPRARRWRGREVGRRLRWKTALTGRPHLSAARESEGGVSGPVGVSGPAAGLGRVEEKKEKR
jgi:hypothetical protein